MVYVAIANLALLAFDFTYLRLRPLYEASLPVVVRVYDPVKGIEPHRRTLEYLARVDAVAALVRARAPAAEVEQALANLGRVDRNRLGVELFESTGQLSLYRTVAARMQAVIQADRGARGERPGFADTVLEFWQVTPDRAGERLAAFDAQVRPLLTRNYQRAFDIDGTPVDHFWLLDLPFLLLFAAEFAARWWLSWRRREYPYWFVYPIINWYDLLSLVPVRGLRVLRLFRVASIVMRLRRSAAAGLATDPVTRAAAFFADIIKEEVSDLVSIRVLEETQNEIRGGTHGRIIQAVVEPRRDALARELALQLQRALESEAVQVHLREVVRLNLEQSVESAPAFRHLPLPRAVLEPLVKGVGQAVFDAFVDTMRDGLRDDDTRALVEAVLADAVDGVVAELTAGTLEEIVREIALDTLERMKQTVAVRKWLGPGERPAAGVPAGEDGRPPEIALPPE